MNNNQLIITNQNSKQALVKSKNLLDITKKLLEKKELIKSFKFKPLLLGKGHSESVNSVAISPDGKYIVSGSLDATVKNWDYKAGECICTIDNTYNISIDKNGYFVGSNGNLNKYLRVSEEPLTQRKLTQEEIKHFRKEGNFLEIDIDENEISILG